MLAGKRLQDQAQKWQQQPTIEVIVELFKPSINFFENELLVAKNSDRRLEVRSFAYFELFGLWSSLAVLIRGTDVEKFTSLLVAATDRYAIPCLVEMLEFAQSGSSSIPYEVVIQNLHVWTQSIMFLLTERKALLPKAAEVVEILREKTVTAGADLIDLSSFANLIVSASTNAFELVETRSGKNESEWTQGHMQQYQQERHAELSKLVEQHLPQEEH